MKTTLDRDFESRTDQYVVRRNGRCPRCAACGKAIRAHRVVVETHWYKDVLLSRLLCDACAEVVR